MSILLKHFIYVLESLFKKLPWVSQSIVPNLQFSDNVVLILERIGEIQLVVQHLKESSKTVELKINASKTNIIMNLVLNDQIMIGDSPIVDTTTDIWVTKYCRQQGSSWQTTPLIQKQHSEMVEESWLKKVLIHLNRSGKNTQKIGSNECKSLLISPENILNTNKLILIIYIYFFHY